MAEQFEQAEQQVRGVRGGTTPLLYRGAENTTPKKLQEKRKRTAKTMPAAKKLRVASEKYEAKAEEKRKKEKKEKKGKERNFMLISLFSNDA